MTEALRDIIFRYAPWIIIVPFLIAVINYKKYTPEFKALSWYMILSFTTQVVSYILWNKRLNNFPVLHVYTIFEYLVLLRFFYLLLKGFIPTALFVFLALSFPLYSIVNSLWVENIFSFNTYSRSVEALVLIFLSVSWFVKTVSAAESPQPGQTAVHFIISGLLIYYTGSVVLFSFGTGIEKLTIQFRINIWFLHTILAILLYVLIAVGLWKQRKI